MQGGKGVLGGPFKSPTATCSTGTQNIMAAKPAKQGEKISMKMQEWKLHGLGQGNWDKGDTRGQREIGARGDK